MANIQAAVRNNRLHIQGKGEEINRGYGFAADITVPKKLISWIQGEVAGGNRAQSLASQRDDYVRGTVEVDEDGDVMLTLSGSSLNTDDGAALIVGNDPEGILRQFAENETENETDAIFADATVEEVDADLV